MSGKKSVKDQSSAGVGEKVGLTHPSDLSTVYLSIEERLAFVKPFVVSQGATGGSSFERRYNYLKAVLNELNKADLFQLMEKILAQYTFERSSRGAFGNLKHKNNFQSLLTVFRQLEKEEVTLETAKKSLTVLFNNSLEFYTQFGGIVQQAFQPSECSEKYGFYLEPNKQSNFVRLQCQIHQALCQLPFEVLTQLEVDRNPGDRFVETGSPTEFLTMRTNLAAIMAETILGRETRIPFSSRRKIKDVSTALGVIEQLREAGVDTTEICKTVASTSDLAKAAFASESQAGAGSSGESLSVAAMRLKGRAVNLSKMMGSLHTYSEEESEAKKRLLGLLNKIIDNPSVDIDYDDPQNNFIKAFECLGLSLVTGPKHHVNPYNLDEKRPLLIDQIRLEDTIYHFFGNRGMRFDVSDSSEENIRKAQEALKAKLVEKNIRPSEIGLKENWKQLRGILGAYDREVQYIAFQRLVHSALAINLSNQLVLNPSLNLAHKDGSPMSESFLNLFAQYQRLSMAIKERDGLEAHNTLVSILIVFHSISSSGDPLLYSAFESVFTPSLVADSASKVSYSFDETMRNRLSQNTNLTFLLVELLRLVINWMPKNDALKSQLKDLLTTPNNLLKEFKLEIVLHAIEQLKQIPEAQGDLDTFLHDQGLVEGAPVTLPFSVATPTAPPLEVSKSTVPENLTVKLPKHVKVVDGELVESPTLSVSSSSSVSSVFAALSLEPQIDSQVLIEPAVVKPLESITAADLDAVFGVVKAPENPFENNDYWDQAVREDAQALDTEDLSGLLPPVAPFAYRTATPVTNAVVPSRRETPAELQARLRAEVVEGPVGISGRNLA